MEIRRRAVMRSSGKQPIDLGDQTIVRQGSEGRRRIESLQALHQAVDVLAGAHGVDSGRAFEPGGADFLGDVPEAEKVDAVVELLDRVWAAAAPVRPQCRD